MSKLNRRRFLELCLKGGASMAALSSMQLQAMNGLVNQSASVSGYKALVCVFLYGGNDSLNMLLPLEGDPLAAYQASRQNLAVSDAIALSPTTAVDGGVGFHPALAPLQSVFEQQRLAMVAGVGSLIEPVTLEQYRAKSVPLPGHLFSHNDQQATWMQGREKATLNYGWGARLLELLEANSHFAANVSLAGNNLWQTGPASVPFAMNKSGITKVYPYRNDTSSRHLAFRAQLEAMFARGEHPLGRSYSDKLGQAVSNTETLNTALESALDFEESFSDNSLAEQLQAVARTLSVQAQFGVGRQVFFVSMGGFDTHDNQNDTQPALLGQLASSLAEFDAVLTQLGLQDSVTTFTMSDFGRTLSSNGDGTDHGWAGNQLLMGGAVNGGEIYGTVLEQALESAYDVGGGRMIPQLSNEQYFASIARWFGASDSELLELFPSLANFNQHYLPLLT